MDGVRKLGDASEAASAGATAGGRFGIDDRTAATILDGAPDPTVVVDAGGTIKYANEQVGPMLGWEPAQLVGQPLEVLVAEPIRERHVGHRTEFARHPRARAMGEGMSLTALRRDGTQIAVEISLSPIDTGDEILVAASIRDITERITAANAVRAERDHAAAVIEALQDGVVEYDGASGRYVGVNQRFCELVGMSPEEVLAAPHPPPWWPEDEAERAAMIGSETLPWTISRTEMLVRHSAGHEFPAAVTFSPISGSGENDRLIVTYHDVTEERRIAAELAAAHALVEVADDRDRIARDLHDRVIQRLFAAGLSLQAAADRADLRERALAVVDDLDAAIGEIRSAIFTLHRPRDVASGLESAMKACSSEAARLLGHQPTVSLRGDLKAVPVDVVHETVTVAREMLSNVAKHARASASWLSVVVDDGLITLAVADDGVGFATTGADAGHGGLGIRNIHERAQRRGGRVTMQPRDPCGTRVEWSVPVAGRAAV